MPTAFAGGGQTARQGDGKTYQLMLFATRLGMTPAMAPFTAGPDWQKHTFTFKDFGLDGSDVTGLFWGAGGTERGTFRLVIDDVQLKPLTSPTGPGGGTR